MKIALIAPTEIPARRANTLQVMKMAQALTVQGHHVQLMSPESRKSMHPSWEDLAHHYGLKHPFQVSWKRSQPWMRRYDYSWQAVRWARRQKADLIYTRLPQAAAIASRCGVPTILEVHDLPHGTAGPFLFHQFLSGKGARRLVIITRALANDLEHRFELLLQPPFTIIAPDGVDLERYKQLPAPEQARQELIQANHDKLAFLNPGRFTAGYTGHLYPGRGSELLLDLCARLPDISFLIVGGEPAQVELMQIQADARRLSNLFLTGFVPNADLPLYQTACDVLLMPYQQKVAASSGGDISRYLSPMKLFEYMACERAIVSSNLPVLGEVLNTQNAVLVPFDLPEAWDKAIRNLKDDPDLRQNISRQARLDAQQYTWESRASRIIAGIGPGDALTSAMKT